MVGTTTDDARAIRRRTYNKSEHFLVEFNNVLKSNFALL
jgi:hypothetical protein